MTATERVTCYQYTRAILIQTTKVLDGQDASLWAAKKTIAQLVENMKRMIELAPRQAKDDLKPPD